MTALNFEVDDALLFPYVIASGEMRFIERESREIYLRNTEGGVAIRGEMPECGPSCHVDLSQLLLEYVMTCEGCGPEFLDKFGERLSKVLLEKLFHHSADLSPEQRVAVAFDCVVGSLGVGNKRAQTADEIRYVFAASPIHHGAQGPASKRWIAPAQHALAILCQQMLTALDAGWVLAAPPLAATETPLAEITLARAP